MKLHYMYCKIRNDLRTKFVVKVWAGVGQCKYCWCFISTSEYAITVYLPSSVALLTSLRVRGRLHCGVQALEGGL